MLMIRMMMENSSAAIITTPPPPPPAPYVHFHSRVQTFQFEENVYDEESKRKTWNE